MLLRVSPGFVVDSAGNRTPPRLRTALDVGRLGRTVRLGDRARLDRCARKHTGWQAAEATGLFRGGRGMFGCFICHATNLLDKSCERNPARLAMDQQKTACLAMDHGLSLRDRQHASRGNPSPALQ